ncbi:MAG TPA: NAD-dependent epimerase/dehydratase family protein, partial [Sphingomonas sp.]|nr:NAD-dependent epimerase/dehydratase family protein [Sphingomonas sp.]
MTAVVVGASGGIGAALVAALEDEGVVVQAFARSWTGDRHIDLEDEATIAAAAARLAKGAAPTLVIVATGLLHDGERGPEKALRDLDPAWL